MRIEKRK